MPHGLDAQTGLLSQSAGSDSRVGFHICRRRLSAGRQALNLERVGSIPLGGTMARSTTLARSPPFQGGEAGAAPARAANLFSKGGLA